MVIQSCQRKKKRMGNEQSVSDILRIIHDRNTRTKEDPRSKSIQEAIEKARNEGIKIGIEMGKKIGRQE